MDDVEYQLDYFGTGDFDEDGVEDDKLGASKGIAAYSSSCVPYIIHYKGAGTYKLVDVDENMIGKQLKLYIKHTVINTMDKKFLPAANAVVDAAGETPTAAEFNALLTSLREAGLLKS